MWMIITNSLVIYLENKPLQAAIMYEDNALS